MADNAYFCGKYLSTTNTISYNRSMNTQLVFENENLKKELKEHDCKREIDFYKNLHTEFKEGKEDKNYTIEKLIKDKTDFIEENTTLKIVVSAMDNPNVVEDIIKENNRLNLIIKDLKDTKTLNEDTIKELKKPIDKDKGDEHVWGSIVNNNLIAKVYKLKAELEQMKKKKAAVTEPIEDKIISEELYKCKHCDDEFDNNGKLERHIIYEHSINNCMICDDTFNGEENLEIHTREKHHNPEIETEQMSDSPSEINGIEENEDISEDTNNESEDDSDERNNFQEECKKCKRTFIMKVLLENHMCTDDGIEDMAHIQETNEVKDYLCEMCGIECESNNQLKKHKKKHFHRNRCELCKTSCKTRGDLRQHMRVIHKILREDWEHIQSDKSTLTERTEEVLKYQCDRCDNEFVKKAQLESHIMNDHVKELLTNNSDHMQTNRTEQMDPQFTSITCNICKKAFISRTDLTKHRQNEHKTYQPCRNVNNCEYGIVCHYSYQPIPDNRYKCFQCGQEFISWKFMMEHRKNTHVDFFNKCVQIFC